jgi:hypothetical protein
MRTPKQTNVLPKRINRQQEQQHRQRSNERSREQKRTGEQAKNRANASTHACVSLEAPNSNTKPTIDSGATGEARSSTQRRLERQDSDHSLKMDSVFGQSAAASGAPNRRQSTGSQQPSSAGRPVIDLGAPTGLDHQQKMNDSALSMMSLSVSHMHGSIFQALEQGASLSMQSSRLSTAGGAGNPVTNKYLSAVDQSGDATHSLASVLSSSLRLDTGPERRESVSITSAEIRIPIPNRSSFASCTSLGSMTTATGSTSVQLVAAVAKEQGMIDLSVATMENEVGDGSMSRFENFNMTYTSVFSDTDD